MCGPAAITQEFSKNLLNGRHMLGESQQSAPRLKYKRVKAANLQVFVGMVKGDAELKIFHSMLKYNDFFVAQNLSGNVITFMGDRPLEGRLWIFKIPRDKP